MAQLQPPIKASKSRRGGQRAKGPRLGSTKEPKQKMDTNTTITITRTPQILTMPSTFAPVGCVPVGLGHAGLADSAYPYHGTPPYRIRTSLRGLSKLSRLSPNPDPSLLSILLVSALPSVGFHPWIGDTRPCQPQRADRNQQPPTTSTNSDRRPAQPRQHSHSVPHKPSVRMAQFTILK
jgi:hypothetical protein